MMMSSAPIPLSFDIDPDSHLVLAQDHCLRTVRPGASAFFRQFVESDCARKVVDAGHLIRSETVSDEPGQGLVLRHPAIPFVLYPHEWTPSMLRDAALMFLDLVEDLERSGYTLKDGTPWNIVYLGPSPVWVDLTSIGDKSVTGSFPARADFLNYFVRTLRLFAANLAPYARLALTQWLGPPPSWLDDPVTLQAVQTIHSGPRSRIRLAARLAKQAIKGRVTRQIPLLAKPLPKTIHGLREYLLKLEILPASGEWSNYYKGQNELPTFDPRSSDISRLAQATPKHKLLFSLIQTCRPKSLLDIGCNTGLYSFMAASLGARAVGLDTDEHAADEMYHAAKARTLEVTTGCGDFVTPLRVSEYLHKPRLRSLHERVRSEMVLCLAVIHHWVFKRLQLKFADVAAILAGVTNHVLVVEFVPPDDQHIRTWITPTYSWYTLDNFVAALRTVFSRVEVHESFPAPRKLLVCYK